jgi:hypothetical protein
MDYLHQTGFGVGILGVLVIGIGAIVVIRRTMGFSLNAGLRSEYAPQAVQP